MDYFRSEKGGLGPDWEKGMIARAIQLLGQSGEKVLVPRVVIVCDLSIFLDALISNYIKQRNDIAPILICYIFHVSYLRHNETF